MGYFHPFSHAKIPSHRSGCIICCYYIMANAEFSAPPVSIGLPGYVYPDEESCLMYDGVPCENVADACCYNAEKYCDDPTDPSTCSQIDNGAYPFGDLRMFGKQMTDPTVLTPFPNAIFWNWATIFVLGFGNLAALDFQVRCMAAKTPRIATLGCLIGGCFTFFIGIPFAYLGAIVRYVASSFPIVACSLTEIISAEPSTVLIRSLPSSTRILASRFSVCRHVVNGFRMDWPSSNS